MEIYLAKNAKVPVCDSVILWLREGEFAVRMYKIRITSPEAGEMWRQCNQSYCNKKFVEGLESESLRYQEQVGNGAHLCIHIFFSFTGTVKSGLVTVRVHGFLGSLFPALKKIDNSYQLTLKISLTRESNALVLMSDIPLNSGKIPATLLKPNEDCMGFGDELCWENWSSLKCTGLGLKEDYEDATVDVILTGDSKENGLAVRCQQLSKCDIYQKMLGEIPKDVTLVSGSGTTVNCHKSLLAVHSELLSARFESGGSSSSMASESSRIEMVDLSEDGLRAFANYVYTCGKELTMARENSAVALELLIAGHDYVIPHLIEGVTKIFKSKPTNWIGVQTAFELFLFVRNAEELRELKQKAVDVLKVNPADLLELQKYKEFVVENPDLAAEASMALFTIT